MQPSISFYNVKESPVCVPLETLLKINDEEEGNYIPRQIPILPDSLIYKNPPPSFRDVAFEVFRSFFRDVIPESDLYTLIARAFSFRVPVFPIDPRTYIIELTHGDGGSYADFGARFTAQLVNYFYQRSGKPAHILFAGTECETLSLAKAFSEFEDIHATFLYPKDPKDAFQPMIKQQFLLLPDHIHIFGVNSSLTDCQAMVQETTRDTDIIGSMELFIPQAAHIGYLLSQVCCCLYAALAVLSRAGYDNSIEQPRLIIGTPLKQPNALTAAVLAKEMGAPINGFITTVNDACPAPEKDYERECRRFKMLYAHEDSERCESEAALFRFNQDSVLDAMRDCKDRTGYIISSDIAEVWQAWNAVKNGLAIADVHNPIESFCTNTGSLPRWISDEHSAHSCITIIPEITHPAFHSEAVRTATGIYPSVPARFEYNPQITDEPVLECASAKELKDWLLSLV